MSPRRKIVLISVLAGGVLVAAVAVEQYLAFVENPYVFQQGGPLDDDFSEGKIPPDDVEQIDLYFFPEGVEFLWQVARLSTLDHREFADRTQIASLLSALGGERSDRNLGKLQFAGLLVAQLIGGKKIPCEFRVGEANAWISPAPHPGEFGSHGHRCLAMKAWLTDVLQSENGKPSAEEPAMRPR
jgi:hypothetical protein